MKSYRSLIHLVAAAVVLSMVGIPEADAARRDSLAGNLLIEDRDDVFLWPQLAVNHHNLIGFEYGANAQSGNGVLIWGTDAMAFGVAVHRGDLFDPQLFPYERGTEALGDVDSPLSDSFDVPTGTAVDLFAGFNLGGGALAGGRLVIGRGSNSVEPADDPDNDEYTSETFFLLQGGYSMEGPLTLDTALRIHYATAGDELGDQTQLEGSEFGVNLKARGYADLGQPFELGFLGDIVYTGEDLEQRISDDLTVSGDLSIFGIQAGAGPVWTLDDDGRETIIAGYAGLSYINQSLDPNTDVDNTSTSISQTLLPGFHLAADFQLLDWLYFRSGAQYTWAMLSVSEEGDDGDNEGSFSGSDDDVIFDSSSLSPGGFAWNAGLGIEVGNFRFDGSFSHGFLTNGPNFIGGGTGFLTMASAEYAWE